MNPKNSARWALVLFTSVAALLLAACGGHENGLPGGAVGDDGGAGFDAPGCAVQPCPSSAPWNSALCACELLDDGGEPVTVDATAQCPSGACSLGFVAEVIGGQCICAYLGDLDATVSIDAQPEDATIATQDAPYFVDAPAYSDDAIYFEDAPYCGNYCGAGYVRNQFCQCVQCALPCPEGESPDPTCSACVGCTQTHCPAGFEAGANCGCVPQGVDAGPPSGTTDGGATCLLAGYVSCQANSWCSLGTCPDGETQYGCYCNANGTATCNLACPTPPACNISGLGTCPYGAQCVYGACESADAGSQLVCSCQAGGNAYCYSYSCADSFGLDSGAVGEAGTSGPSCLLEGYETCPVGQYCSLGNCPGGTSYGCTCKADGTTDCNLVCPPPGPCTVPGLGTCPYGQSCTFGSCADGGSELVCSCEQGGQVSCYTNDCKGGEDL